MAEPTLTLTELERLLDVHGTDRARWPADAWDAAARLVATSPAARALWDEVAAFDHALGALPPETPSAALAERVLAAAPARSSTGTSAPMPWRWRRVAAAFVPLATAAGLALWLASGTTIDRTPTPLPTAAELTSLRLGEYESPTDYLLESSDFDVAATVPSFGCADSALGCTTLDAESAATAKEDT